MNRIMLSCAVASVLLLQACATDVDNDPRFGDAVHNNINAQIANPNAPDAEPLKAEGARAAGAQGRYTTGTTKEPKDISTSGTGGSSASSGSN